MRILKLHLEHQNEDLKEEYMKILNDNMRMALEQGSYKQRDWVKKMHHNLSMMKENQKNFFGDFLEKIMKENK